MAAFITPSTPEMHRVTHRCSNCERPTVLDAFTASFARYTCPICGQREQVAAGGTAGHVVDAIEVLEEPTIILGEG